MTHHTEMLTVLRALLVLPYALVAGSLGGTPFARALGACATVLWVTVALPVVIVLAILTTSHVQE